MLEHFKETQRQLIADAEKKLTNFKQEAEEVKLGYQERIRELNLDY